MLDTGATIFALETLNNWLLRKLAAMNSHMLCNFIPTTYLYNIMYDGSYSCKEYSKPVRSLSWSQFWPVVSGGSVPCHKV